MFWAQGAKVSQGSLAPSEICFAPVQPYLHQCKRILLPGSKRPPAPSRNHFREFPIFDPLSQAAWFARQICCSKLQRFFTLGDGCWLPIQDIFGSEGPERPLQRAGWFPNFVVIESDSGRNSSSGCRRRGCKKGPKDPSVLKTLRRSIP